MNIFPVYPNTLVPGTEAPNNDPVAGAVVPLKSPPLGAVVLPPKLNRPPVGFGGSLPSLFLGAGYVAIEPNRPPCF